MSSERDRPDWDRLFETAVGQEGHFSTAQAAEAGYSPQLLNRHLRSGTIRRVRRGVYRLVHFPTSEQEDLVELWLWSDRTGVLSHETALALHDLSDLLPARVHLTLPAAWRTRRLRMPEGAALHFADVPEPERSWIGAVPVTAPLRTIVDCARDDLSPDLLRQAVEQALARGLVSRGSLRDAAVSAPVLAGVFAA